MIHHPVILVPKLVLLAVIVAVLFILYGMLTPGQFMVAVVVAAIAFVGGSIGIWVVAMKLLGNPNSRLGKHTVLSSQMKSADGFKASSDKAASLVGKRGAALSNLNPAGTVEIEGQRIPVVSNGAFIEAETPVEVVEARGSRIVVAAIKQDEDAA